MKLDYDEDLLGAYVVAKDELLEAIMMRLESLGYRSPSPRLVEWARDHNEFTEMVEGAEEASRFFSANTLDRNPWLASGRRVLYKGKQITIRDILFVPTSYGQICINMTTEGRVIAEYDLEAFDQVDE